MIIKLIKSIAQALKSNYESNVYVDQLPQGMKNGDIFVLPVETTRTQINGNLWRNEYNMDVHIFQSSRMQGLQQAEEVKRLLEWIDYKGDGLPIRGKDISANYIDGVAHIFVTYVLDEKKEKHGEKMEVLKVEGGLKE